MRMKLLSWSKRKGLVLIPVLIWILIGLCHIVKKPLEKQGFEKVSDLAYAGSGREEPIVYIEEKEGYQPYLVLTNNYNGKTLLLRKALLSEDRRVNQYSSYYEQSEIDIFLNEEFIHGMPQYMIDLIEETEIQILDERCLNRIDDKVVSLSRKVFLLSYIELGYDENGHVGIEGKPLDYFKHYENRRAADEKEGRACSWWLRSADSTYDSCVYAVGPEGEIGSTNAFGLNGVRPAFCIDGSIRIRKQGGVYVLG